MDRGIRGATDALLRATHPENEDFRDAGDMR
jgi:hypothetical protein